MNRLSHFHHAGFSGGTFAVVAGVLLSVTGRSAASDRIFEATFPAQPARFVRVLIQSTNRGQPCLDELEVYGPGGTENLALSSRGSRPGASSCLPGYDKHRIEHLNDGHYGNSRSWIAGAIDGQWAQIELPEAAPVGRVVISRDREGQYSDRIPVAADIQLSLDGQKWETTATMQNLVPKLAAKSAAPPYLPPAELPSPATWDSLLRYSFLCEKATWERMDASDHLSPLRTGQRESDEDIGKTAAANSAGERPALPGGPPYWGRIAKLKPAERVLTLLGDMIDRLAGKGIDVESERRELVSLRRRAAEDDARLYFEARLAKRRLMLRDPDLAALRRILFVKRHPYLSSHNYSDILDSKFTSGGGICLLEIPRRNGRLAPEEGVVKTLFDAGGGIARDPMADFDGGKIFFAYRPDEKSADGSGAFWHLMEVNADGSGLRQLTSGPFHDYYPCPLPDGGLAFISTRCRARFLCWRPQAFVLFRMDGDDIQPLSFANLSEWTPAVMRDGRLLWTRSEYIDKGADFGHTLWAIRPDGTHPELVFGNNTPNCYINGREVPGANEILCTLFSHGGDHNGPLGLIDLTRAGGPSDPDAITNITPDTTPHYNMQWPRYECWRDPVPVTREYFLASHSPADHWGLYLVDRYGNRELLHLDPAIGSMTPSPLRPVTPPPVLAGPPSGQPGEDAGQFSLEDIYEGLGPAVPRGAVKYLRVCQEVRADLVQLDDGSYQSDHEAFRDWYATPIHKVNGPNGWPSYVAKASLGIVPVESDGSASFYAPAGKVLYFQALDENFNELQRMRSVIQLQPGEKRSCIGCHEHRHGAPPLRESLASARIPSRLDPPPWGAGPFSYERIVQPVLDRHCVRCHNREEPHGILLTGDLDAERVPASYRALIEGGWVHYFDMTWKLRHQKADPATFGTLASKLWDVLEPGHHAVSLSRDEVRAIKCWTDLNCPLWPDYQFRLDRRDASLSAAP